MTAELAKVKIFLQLVYYFCNASYHSTISSLPKSFVDSPLLAQGWIPLRDLATFKKMKGLITQPADIAESIIYSSSELFELSVDGVYLRRKTEFVASKVFKEMFNISLLAGYAMEAVGFDQLVTVVEVEAYFSRFGEIQNVSKHIGISTWDERYNLSFFIEFKELDSMIKSLAATHMYEDSSIQVRAHRKPDVSAAMVVISQAGSTYPKGKIVEFKLVSDVIESVEQYSIQEQFEKYATVAMIDYVKGNATGYIEFKQSVALEAISVIFNNGGLHIQGEPIQLRALVEDEEQMYWMVKAEKQMIQGPNRISVLDLAHAAKFSKQAIQQQKITIRRKGKAKKIKGRTKTGTNRLTKYHSREIKDCDSKLTDTAKSTNIHIDETVLSALGVKHGKNGVGKTTKTLKFNKKFHNLKRHGTSDSNAMQNLLEGFDRI
ncbi:hypothetical protein BATDEDRAFT_92158 [Batrachochytrium dendrobatidis JAM81]|uniref:Uncharacterized protein n=2 Tax=Batrachochytrium dendrobatidis TaxID=109871 RepID=F4PCR8_BATDJ|nr:uncharacterized protein BATDEDRAFT_92158 [Batrachochytrium dendrobatidis JAM81]EGF76877.1 hypothetical protein BATDEDRAFT_92158 [Batrachochytrium dendrobatidis JAM81]OAJ44941.1 hypothetical protein BDEG_28119 [Batrachochytrium dendrobatidis JEL423]|eukprot:XP_006682486.1 hypothetical protein BATDEDRAFT_92158 [Batrachochytrium dendrobatidis JAM81]